MKPLIVTTTSVFPPGYPQKKENKGLLHNSPEKKTELSTTEKVEESSVLL